MPNWNVSPCAAKLHADALAWDNHACVTRPVANMKPGVTLVQSEQLQKVTEGLLRLGYSDEEVRAVLGESWLRIARQVWK